MQSITIGKVGIGGHLATLSETDFIARVGKQLGDSPIFKGRTEAQRIDWLKAAHKAVKEANGVVDVAEAPKVVKAVKEGEQGAK